MKPIDVLLVEDNSADARLAEEALKESKSKIKLHVVKDGVEALEFLFRRGAYTAAPRPDLILLDLNLPRKSGREVLEEIKSSEALKRIPVVVLSSSQAEQDIIDSYARHANSYVTKPLDFEEFVKVIKSIDDFWFGTAKLPARQT